MAGELIEGCQVGYCPCCPEGVVFFDNGIIVCRTCRKQFQSTDEVSVDGINQKKPSGRSLVRQAFVVIISTKELSIPVENFMKPYIKDSKFNSLMYKNSFGNGTCAIYYANAELYNRIMMSLKYVREVVPIK